ncbi:MAG: HAD hydrolase-like protein [Lachnospiraceae bacterium]
MFRYVLFDLDGTLTDPKTGITSCVQYALADAGIEEPDLDKLEPFIGPASDRQLQGILWL